MIGITNLETGEILYMFNNNDWEFLIYPLIEEYLTKEQEN